MSITEDQKQEMLRNAKNRTFTLREAIEFQKEMDKYVTTHTLDWVKADTKQPVVIGYNH